jgi:hypothetical protein
VPLVVLLIVEGLHVPTIPFVEVVGNAGAVEPEQILKAAPKLKVDVSIGFTVTLIVTGIAHNPAVGVNV